jgi:hypothetical protein
MDTAGRVPGMRAAMSSTATFAAVAVSVYAAHQVGDYWVQSSDQAARKGQPGWVGRLACASHVLTYSVTLVMFVALADWWAGLHLVFGWLEAGIGLSAVTHYFADRRRPLAWVAAKFGKTGFYEAGSGLATGAALLDQAWHWGWLFASALVISGGPK